MSSEGDRIERAGDYIMGRMSQAERERAERDLERTRRGEPARETGITPTASAEEPAAIWQLPERFAP